VFLPPGCCNAETDEERAVVRPRALGDEERVVQLRLLQGAHRESQELEGCPRTLQRGFKQGLLIRAALKLTGDNIVAASSEFSGLG